MIRKYRFLSLLLLTALAAPALAQPTQLPDLKAKLASLGKTPHDDSVRVDTWLTMAMLYSRISLDSGQMMANHALKLSKRIGYKYGQAQSMLAIANIDFALGKIDKAEAGYLALIPLYVEINNLRGEASCYANLGAIAVNSERLQEARRYFLKAIPIYQQVDPRSHNLAIAYANLGESYLREGQKLDSAEMTLRRASEIADEVGQVGNRIMTYLTLGDCLKQRGKITEGVGFGLKALQLARAHDDFHGTALAYTFLSAVYVERHENDKALSYLTEAEVAFEQVEDKLQLAGIYLRKGELLLEGKQYKEALEAYKKLLPIVKRMDVNSEIQRAYNGLAQAYAALGEPEKAAQYKAKALAAGELIVQPETTPPASEERVTQNGGTAKPGE